MKTLTIAAAGVLVAAGLGLGTARYETIDTSLFVDAGPAPRTIEADRFIQAPPEVVFDQISTPEGVQRWLGIDANINLAIGGAYELLFEPGRGRGNQGTEGSQVLSYVPGRVLSVSWNAPTRLGQVRGLRSWVTFVIEPARGGSSVTVTHAGFGDTPGWDKAYRYYETGWPMVLGSLKRSLEPTGD